MQPQPVLTHIPRSHNPDVWCAYYIDSPGHDTKSCWRLKHRVLDLIDSNAIAIDSLVAHSISLNPLHSYKLVHLPCHAFVNLSFVNSIKSYLFLKSVFWRQVLFNSFNHFASKSSVNQLGRNMLLIARRIYWFTICYIKFYLCLSIKAK